MSILGLNEEEFRQILAENLTPARAISSPQHLKGRAQKLQQIDRAFNSPGKHVFIYGDRGVGKTSLAQTAAILRQSSDAKPILVACGGMGFLKTMRDAIRSALPIGDSVFQKKVEQRLRLGTNFAGYEFSKSLVNGAVPPIESVNDAVLMLKFVSEFHSKEPVIIIDEFDQLENDMDRKFCADIIKQISDQGINIRLIICGIGTSLEDLIGVHLSTGRYIYPIELERLTHDARWDIINSAAKALGVEIQQSHLLRIGQISDGFPYYVHLMGEQLLWSVFDDAATIQKCEQKHFEVGVKGAIAEAETTLKILYEKATQKYSDVYPEILWAFADDSLLRRQISDVYTKSYLRIMSERLNRTPLHKDAFYNRVANLKSARHGHIIVAKGAGWYEYRENIVRGYVRLRAENEAIQLGKEGFA
jgi:hypothetical protein